MENNSYVLKFENDTQYCSICKEEYKFTRQSEIKRHVKSNRHIKNTEKMRQTDVFENIPNQRGSLLNSIDDLSQPVKQSSNVHQQDLPHNNNSYDVERYSNLNSFSTNYATDWEKLSRTCSSVSQMSEAAKLLLKEKDTQLIELKQKINKLEEKLEHNDCEIQLRNQVDGAEVQLLKIQLTEVAVRLEERDKQLAEIKQQLQEWMDTANKLINSRADFEEWKKQIERISVPDSVNLSSVQSFSCSQNSSKEFKESHQQSPGGNQSLKGTNNIDEENDSSMPIYKFDCIKNSNLLDEDIAEQINTKSKIPQRIIENNNTDDHNYIDGETQEPLSFVQ